MVTPLSPNFGPRRDGLRPELVVLHYTAMESCAAAQARLCDPEHEVSAHWLISEQGEVTALVPEEMRAWHAGAGTWRGRDDVNSRSIGVELANRGDHPFPDPQMRALEDLLRGIFGRWHLRPEDVIGHSDMAPLRKADPGPRFDWRRLARQGLSVWPDPGRVESVDPAAFDRAAIAFGYPDRLPHGARLEAFRLRFRPGAEGGLGPADIAAAQDLARRFGIDPADARA